jgi:hypothetical protein
VNSSHILIKDNSISDYISQLGAICFRLLSGVALHTSILNNKIYSCANGVEITNQGLFGWTGKFRDILIAENEIHNNDSCGILIYNSFWNGQNTFDSIRVTTNRIYTNGYDGIRLYCIPNYPGYLNIFSHVGIDNNYISSNGGDGLSLSFLGIAGLVTAAFNNFTFLNDSIFNNGGLGINIMNVGDTTLPATPVFPSPTLAGISQGIDSFEIQGTIHSPPNEIFRIDYFYNSACDPSVYGEGEAWIGADTIITDSGGFGIIQFKQTGVAADFYTATATSLASGNTSVFSNCADIYTGVEVLDSQNKFILFPNPFRDKIYFSFDGNYSVRLIDLSGRCILEKHGINELNVDFLPRGIYFCELMDEKGHLITSEKIVKE